MSSEAMHILLYGGARSGKTFAIIRAIVIRAMAVYSRHAVLRFRFNHLKASIIYDTLPKVMALCYPDVAPLCKLDKVDWFYRFPNESEIWFGGLDDKERTEKILGQEYSSIFLNECSQIPWASRNIATTRLAQKNQLRLKLYYDCNPPSMAHWTYRVFVEKRDPDSKIAYKNPNNFASLLMNPRDNKENLPDSYLDNLQALPPRERRRFWDGQFGDAAQGALWSLELIEQQRRPEDLPVMQRVVVGVDPSGCSGAEDVRSDEIGIVVAGLGIDGKAYVLEDLSGKMSAQEWPGVVNVAYERHEADKVIAEANFGGDMVRQVMHAHNPNLPVKIVKASRGSGGVIAKVVRAEPIAALFDQQKVCLAGHFPELEDQMCSMTMSGYTGSRSPDRLDAMVWAITELFPKVTKRESTYTPKVISRYASAKRFLWRH